MVLKKSSSSPSLVFKVRRKPTELVAPAGPTPHELKLLSDLDDHNGGMRHHLLFVQFFPYNPSMARKDPVHVVREALSKALVLYYPLAGRLREGTKGNLMVDCTAEGVSFIEADADVTLEYFGVDIMPPFPCFDELLYLAPSFDSEILNAPLVLIQVTRLKCGGFIFASRLNHTMFDGVGVGQFMNAIAEIARGASKPSITPVWCRELLCARDPPRITCFHPEFPQQQEVDDDESDSSLEACEASFFFGPKEIDAMRRLLPPHLAQSSTTSEVLTAFLWRCRTVAMDCKNPNQEVCLIYVINARFGPSRLNPPLPEGFYGNAFVEVMIVSTVGKLCGQPLSYALELLKKGKKEVNDEYVHSFIDRMVINKEAPPVMPPGFFFVSDNRNSGFKDVDFGWGKPLYSGSASNGDVPWGSTFFSHTNSRGVHGTLALICLLEKEMKRFEKELDGTLHINHEENSINPIPKL